MSQTDVELNPEVIDEIVEETGRAWMAWVFTPIVLLVVAGVAFFIIRRFFGNSEM